MTSTELMYPFRIRSSFQNYFLDKWRIKEVEYLSRKHRVSTGRRIPIINVEIRIPIINIEIRIPIINIEIRIILFSLG